MANINAPTGAYYQSVTVSSTALSLVDMGFTQLQADVSAQVRITVETQPLRYRYDGGTATAALGHELVAGDVLILSGANNLQNLSVIRSTANDSTMQVTLEVD